MLDQLKDHHAVVQQLLDAKGWFALYANSDYSGFFECPIIAWALIKIGDTQDLLGIVPFAEMSGELSIAPWDDNFIGYLHETEDTPADIQARILVVKEIAEEEKRELDQAPRKARQNESLAL